jgi:hypothetical protein
MMSDRLSEQSMHKQQSNNTAANCCLVPLLVVVALAIAAVVAIGVLGTAVIPAALTRIHFNHASDAANDDGYKRGHTLGAGYAIDRQPVPTAWDLEVLAQHEAEKAHIRHDRPRWTRSFKNGFAHGYKEANKPAFQ